MYLVRLADYLSYMGLAGLWISMSFTVGPLTKVHVDTIYLLCEIINKGLADYLNNAARRELAPSLARQQVQLQPFSALPLQGHTQDQSKASDYEDIRKYWVSNGPLSWLLWPAALVLGSLIGIVPLFFSASDRSLLGVRRISETRLIPLVRKTFVNRTAGCMILFFMNLSIILLMFVSAWELLYFRQKMKNTPFVLADEWGFGQITAVLLWAPTSFWILRNFLRLVPWLEIILYVVTKLSPGSGKPSVMTSEIPARIYQKN